MNAREGCEQDADSQEEQDADSKEMECVMTEMTGATDLTRNAMQATDLMRNAMQATQNYNAKIVEFASANCNATLTYFSKLATIKTPSEFIDFTTRHAREQTDILTRQARELTEMTQKLFPKGSS